ncbi:HAMP domain-containing sensor histidine kinase [Actinoplanes sp. NPDC026619]|uniref:sensor histidine kinase n=1 Tax=Actinoplanes sp. NPDC026619 TaxID=3155798 RepID=UPI0034087EC9
MRGLRGRLLLITTMLLVAGIVASDVVVVGVLRHNLVERVDRQLAQLAQILSRFDPALFAGVPGTQISDLEVTVTYFSAAGQVQSTAHSGTESARLGPDPAAEVSGTGGSRWRVATVPRPAGRGTVAVAGNLAGVQDTVGRLRLVCTITGLVLVLFLAAAGWFAVRRGLRPLRTIESTAIAIAAGDLTHRIPAAGPPGTEIARLTGALNGMIAQLDRAFAARTASEARMRRFVADVSHELRTPLFGIKGSTELHLMGGGGDPEQALRRIDTEAGRLAALVEDLLLLARMDETEPVLDRAPMDLRTLAASARADLLALDPVRPVRITGPGGAGEATAAPVHGDEARLRQVVVNLAGNVHAHTPPDAPVRIGVGRVGGASVLEIADSGPGFPSDLAIFDRFVRGDASRSRASRAGAGLGLAIVHSLVTAHGGRLTATSDGSGATFRIVLPTADSQNL